MIRKLVQNVILHFDNGEELTVQVPAFCREKDIKEYTITNHGISAPFYIEEEETVPLSELENYAI